MKKQGDSPEVNICLERINAASHAVSGALAVIFTRPIMSHSVAG